MIYIDKHINRRLFSESLRAAASLWRGSTCTNWSYFFVLIQSTPTVRKQALASFEVGTHPRPPGRTTAIHTFQGKRRLLSKEVFRTWENPCTGRKWPKHNRTRHFLLVKHKALGAAWRTKKAWARGILAHFQEGEKKKKHTHTPPLEPQILPPGRSETHSATLAQSLSPDLLFEVQKKARRSLAS